MTAFFESLASAVQITGVGVCQYSEIPHGAMYLFRSKLVCHCFTGSNMVRIFLEPALSVQAELSVSLEYPLVVYALDGLVLGKPSSPRDKVLNV